MSRGAGKEAIMWRSMAVRVIREKRGEVYYLSERGSEFTIWVSEVQSQDASESSEIKRMKPLDIIGIEVDKDFYRWV